MLLHEWMVPLSSVLGTETITPTLRLMATGAVLLLALGFWTVWEQFIRRSEPDGTPSQEDDVLD